jgi:hypothetical protein
MPLTKRHQNPVSRVHYSHPPPKLDTRNSCRIRILPGPVTGVTCSLLGYDGGSNSKNRTPSGIRSAGRHIRAAFIEISRASYRGVAERIGGQKAAFIDTNNPEDDATNTQSQRCGKAPQVRLGCRPCSLRPRTYLACKAMNSGRREFCPRNTFKSP